MKKIPLLFFLFCAPFALRAQNDKPVAHKKADTLTYMASYEAGRALIEDQLFGSVTATRKPYSVTGAAMPIPAGGFNNQFLSALTRNSRIGTTLLLKVDSADVFDVCVNGFMGKKNKHDGNKKSVTPDMFGVLSSLFWQGIDNNGKALVYKSKGMAPGWLPNIADAYNQSISKNKTGSLNWIIMDSTLKITGTKDIGFLSVEDNSKMNYLCKTGLRINSSGYILFFLSNESDGTVYFDDFLVKHYQQSANGPAAGGAFIITESGLNITTETNINLITEN
jgi:hypothetical protein